MKKMNGCGSNIVLIEAVVLFFELEVPIFDRNIETVLLLDNVNLVPQHLMVSVNLEAELVVVGSVDNVNFDFPVDVLLLAVMAICTQ